MGGCCSCRLFWTMEFPLCPLSILRRFLFSSWLFCFPLTWKLPMGGSCLLNLHGRSWVFYFGFRISTNSKSVSWKPSGVLFLVYFFHRSPPSAASWSRLENHLSGFPGIRNAINTTLPPNNYSGFSWEPSSSVTEVRLTGQNAVLKTYVLVGRKVCFILDAGHLREKTDSSPKAISPSAQQWTGTFEGEFQGGHGRR